MQFFNEQFPWEHGDYHLTVKVTWGNPTEVAEQHLRFTLFESDSRALRDLTDDYPYGYGAFLKSRMEPVSVPLQSAVLT